MLAVSFGTLAAVLLVVPIGTAVFHAGAYVAAAVRRRRHAVAAGCARDAPPRGRALLRIVAAETAASLWLTFRALRPFREPVGDPEGARLAALLLAPAWLPARCLAVLAARLARAGALVGVARAPAPPEPSALARLAWRVEALQATCGSGRIAIVAFGAASRTVAPLVGTLPRGAVRHAVLLGANATTPPVPGVETTAIRAAGDPWDTAPSSAMASTSTIELTSIGHCTLLVAPQVAELVWERCTDVA